MDNRRIVRVIIVDFFSVSLTYLSRARLYINHWPNNPIVMEQNKLLLINFNGQILPMTKEEYNDFLESIKEWDN